MQGSPVSWIGRGVVIVIALASVGIGTAHHRQVVNAQTSNVQMIHDLNDRIAREKGRHPTRKKVTTNYQRGMNLAKKYLKVTQDLAKLGSHGDPKKIQHDIDLLKKYSSGSNAPMGTLLPKGGENWHPEVSYGGQGGHGRVTMAFKWYNDQHQLMQIDSFYYNPNSNTFSGFATFMTNQGRDVTNNVKKAGDKTWH